LEYARAGGPAQERDRIELARSLGNILFREDRWNEAEAFDREALEIALARPEKLSAEIFMLRGDLGGIYTNVGSTRRRRRSFRRR